MIIERTVYDVKCSRCWRTIAKGFDRSEDAEIAEGECSVVIDGVEHVLCVKCEDDEKKGEAA